MDDGGNNLDEAAGGREEPRRGYASEVGRAWQSLDVVRTSSRILGRFCRRLVHAGGGDRCGGGAQPVVEKTHAKEEIRCAWIRAMKLGWHRAAQAGLKYRVWYLELFLAHQRNSKPNNEIFYKYDRPSKP